MNQEDENNIPIRLTIGGDFLDFDSFNKSRIISREMHLQIDDSWGHLIKIEFKNSLDSFLS